MLGLTVLFVIGAYLIISALVVWSASRWAKKHGRRGWVWGGVVAFAMYNLVFWDLIPTLALHKYYCATEAGFWVYKTPEQWVKENPGVAETLTWKRQTEYLRPGNRLNERFVLDHKENKKSKLFPVRSMEMIVKDIQTGEILVKAIGISSGYGAFGVGMEGSWRFWTTYKPCAPYPQLPIVIEQYEHLGREIK